MSTKLHDRERQLRAELKQMSQEDDGRHYERVVRAVALWDLWHTPEFADASKEIERLNELDMFLQNMFFGFRNFKLMLEFFPNKPQWINANYDKMIREAYQRQQTKALAEAAKKRQERERIQRQRQHAARPALARSVESPLQSSTEQPAPMPPIHQPTSADRQVEQMRRWLAEALRDCADLRLKLVKSQMVLGTVTKERDALKAELRALLAELEAADA